MKLERPHFRAQVACALAALGSSALLADGVLASPAAASAGRARVPQSAQRPAGRLPNRSAHRAGLPRPAQRPAVRLPNRSAHRAGLPKRAQRPAARLLHRSAHAADAYTPFTIKLGPANGGFFPVLDVSGASTSPGAPVIDYWHKYYDDANQYWTVYPRFGYQYYYYIVNQNSGQCLTSDGVAGDQVYQWPCVGSPAQQWTRNTYQLTRPIEDSNTADTWQNVYSGLYLEVYGANVLPALPGLSIAARLSCV